MRNAALMLGVVGGLWGMLIGFFSFAYTEVLARYADLADLTGGVENVALVRAVSLGAPILALAGGAMSRSHNRLAAVLLLTAAAGMQAAFGFGVFTMFPIAMCVAAGLLALVARTPDPH